VLLVTAGALMTQFAAAQAQRAVIRSAAVLGSGSDTTWKMMDSLDRLYNESAGCAVTGNPQPLDLSCVLPDPTGTITTENYAHDRISEAYPLGSSNGINQLCEQGLQGVAKINFARSSRAPGSSDCTGLRFVAFARDGIPFEAFPDLPGSPVANFNNPDPLCAGKGLCLTQAQIVGIFVTCTITNWNQVGGANAPIEVFTAQDGSGTRKTFDGFIGGDSSTCIPVNDLDTHKIFENENTSIFANAHAAENAIFYFSFGVWQNDILPNPDGSALGGIDGVAPTVQTIGDGSFPYGRYLYNVYCNTCPTNIQASGATKKYINETTGWLCKNNNKHSIDPLTGDNYGTELDKTIASEGFVSIPPGGPGTNKCKLFTT
jgi:ABC-type phosphate transport system substrate-binding protein